MKSVNFFCKFIWDSPEKYGEISPTFLFVLFQTAQFVSKLRSGSRSRCDWHHHPCWSQPTWTPFGMEVFQRKVGRIKLQVCFPSSIQLPSVCLSCENLYVVSDWNKCTLVNFDFSDCVWSSEWNIFLVCAVCEAGKKQYFTECCFPPMQVWWGFVYELEINQWCDGVSQHGERTPWGELGS